MDGKLVITAENEQYEVSVRGQPAPPLNDADIAAMGAAGNKYNYTFDQ